MNQHLAKLADWIVENDWPDTTCPFCRSTTLSVQAIEDLPTAQSTALQQTHPAWEPDWITGKFRGVLRCNAKRCGEDVLVTGEMRIIETTDGFHEQTYDSSYLLRFAQPSLPLIEFAEDCPESVRHHVDQAATLLWASPGAAAGRLRLAIEQLLTELGDASKRPLDRRLSDLKKTEPDVADTLLAVKWIGNQGVHEETLSATDVLDGAKLLDHALDLLYRHPQMKALATQINADKGIRRHTATP
ncbi:DUF4145 domain-containing protein [Micromonospora rubida]|uniref:DUF4145 domain-containing protein n=1 Tax=Micromonospora rubida TaxID=2697657 RepID=UPI0013772701|nr:DUF4145 domain-containing protein [Micromonospora rubida]NBE81025.1 DUF4145 domain-containing protein [Micromonospora rubida]